jgi:hypothetical protein
MMAAEVAASPFSCAMNERGSWIPSKIINGDTGGRRGEDNSVRAAAVHRDRVTGLESLFLSVGIHGIYVGRYDPSLPCRIAWEPAPEPGTTTGTRILSIVEANDSLFFSEGTRILRRVDGPSPRYVQVADLSGEVPSGTDRAIFQSIGGIRGLSAIDGPIPRKQSLIFMWHPGPRSSLGCVMRLDPHPDGSYALVREACLADQVRTHLDGAPVSYVLGAYNNFMPLRDPKSNEPVTPWVWKRAFPPRRRVGALRLSRRRTCETPKAASMRVACMPFATRRGDGGSAR